MWSDWCLKFQQKTWSSRKLQKSLHCSPMNPNMSEKYWTLMETWTHRLGKSMRNPTQTSSSCRSCRLKRNPSRRIDPQSIPFTVRLTESPHHPLRPPHHPSQEAPATMATKTRPRMASVAKKAPRGPKTRRGRSYRARRARPIDEQGIGAVQRGRGWFRVLRRKATCGPSGTRCAPRVLRTRTTTNPRKRHRSNWVQVTSKQEELSEENMSKWGYLFHWFGTKNECFLHLASTKNNRPLSRLG